MNNYKKVVLLSIVFASVFFFLDKLLMKEKGRAIPDPEIHIRYVVGLLEENELDEYMSLVFPEEVLKNMSEEEGIGFFSGFPGMNESMGRIAWELMRDLENEFWSNYENSFEAEFKDARKKLKKSKNIEIERIHWKLVGNSKTFQQFRCNAKIYVKVNSKKYCIKYKNFLFYGGKWYAGNLTEVDEVTDSDYEELPDMYQAPAVEEYMDKTEEVQSESPQKAVESDPNGEDLPVMEED